MAVPTFGKSKLPRSHDECRALVCCVCSKKVKKISPQCLSLVKNTQIWSKDLFFMDTQHKTHCIQLPYVAAAG